MGYKITGHKVSGYNIIGETNFLSIPGLKLWISGDNAITFDGSGNILNVSDRSQYARLNVLEANALRRPTLDSDASGLNFIKTIKVGTIQQRLLYTAPDKHFDFMHKGKAFGHFSIVDLATANTTAVELLHVIGPGYSNNSKGYTCRYREDLHVWNMAVFNGGLGGNYLFHNISRNVKNQPEFIQHTFKGHGVASGSQVYFNKTLVSTATNSANPFTTDRSDSYIVYRSEDATGGEARGYMTLLYDWDGYSSSQIDTYRQRVQAITYDTYGAILPVS